jgi:predicted ATPase/GAF domain-containing protein/DNA-binding CsgD family transcriptional regulator
LILVLDDLQWADEDTLEVLIALAGDSQPHALLIGIVRTGDLGRAAPAASQESPAGAVGAALAEAGVEFDHLALEPLGLAAVNELAAAMLRAAPAATLPLARRIQLHAQGTPFFAIELIRTLVDAGAVTPAASPASYTWDPAAVDQLHLSDDVASLLARAIDDLPAETQHLLCLGALLGAVVDPDTLAHVQQTPPERVAAALQPALRAGLLAPPDAPSAPTTSLPASIPRPAVRFQHERVREAALHRLSDRERMELHLCIGRALLALAETAHAPGADPDTAGDRRFAAVHHLHAAASLLDDPIERRTLARLSIEASRRERNAAAFPAAWATVQQGLALLHGDDPWTGDADLALELHLDGAEMAFLNGQHATAERLAREAAAHARDTLDRLRASQMHVQAAIARNDLDCAMELAASALQPLGISLPRRSDPLTLLASLARTRRALAGRAVEDLAALPPVTDSGLQAAGRLMASIGHALQWQGNRNRIALLTLAGIRLSLRRGLFPTSAVGYAGYGAMLCMVNGAPGLGGVETAARLGQLAMQLAGRPEVRPYQARIAVPVHYIITHRHMHHRASLAPLLDGYQAGLESGDPEAALLCALCYVSHAFQLGLPLATLEGQIGEFSAAAVQYGQRAVEMALALNHQAVLNLLGRSADPLRLTGAACDEESVQHELAQSDSRGTLTAFLIVKAHLAYQFDDIDAALALADQVRPRLREIAGFFAYPRFLALDALIRLAACDQAGRGARRRLLRQAKGNLRLLQTWARETPMNHLHDVRLAQAELARVQGRRDEAAAHYAAAIALSRQHGWVADEPLAAERAARFFLAAGQTAQAREFLHLAQTGYRGWGALAVVQHIDRVYGAWLSEWPVESAGPQETHPAGASSAIEAAAPPGLSALFTAAQAATGADDLAELVQRLMALAMEHSAAERGVLLAPDPAQDPAGETVAGLRVEAECLAAGPRRVLHGERLMSQTAMDAAAPLRVVNYVVHSRQRLALADVSQEIPFDSDPAVAARQVRSLLCLPLRQPGRLLGVLYLENLPGPDLLTAEQADALALLATQAALAVQNARLREGSRQVDKAAARQVDKETVGEFKGEAGDMARWAAARLRQANLHLQEGRWAEANAQADEALAIAHHADSAAAWRSVSLGFGAELALLPGGLQRCQVVAQQAAALAPAGDDPWQGARLAQQATLAWLLGRLDEVLKTQREALALIPPETTFWTTALNDLVGLAASARTARREYDQAQGALEMQANRLRHGGSGPMRTARLLFRQARLDWLRGKTSTASGLAHARQFFAEQPDHPWANVLIPTLAGMAALAEERPDMAEQHLRQASAAEAITPAAGLLVRPSLLLAHALHAQGAADAALEVLTPVLETCRLAHTPGLVVQEGAAVIPVLRLAAQQGRGGPTAAHVLSLLGVSNVTRRLLVPETGIVLSPREVDVLELLAANASNRAIAERLDVDIATVKSHVTRVLAKLGVPTRYEAAERARALGLGNGW